MHRHAVTLLAFLFASLLLPARASAVAWVPIGPADGGFVYALAFDPVNAQIAYAGLAGGGVVKTTDGGRTWFSSGFGLDGSSTVTALMVHPLDPRRVYAVTSTGLFRSTDHVRRRGAGLSPTYPGGPALFLR